MNGQAVGSWALGNPKQEKIKGRGAQYKKKYFLKAIFLGSHCTREQRR